MKTEYLTIPAEGVLPGDHVYLNGQKLLVTSCDTRPHEVCIVAGGRAFYWDKYQIVAIDRPVKETQPARSARELVAAGYRKVSNKHGIVARIDRSDWVEVMAKALNCAPADFYVPGTTKPTGQWCDYYRRCLSKDTLTVDEQTLRLIPSSNGDAVGYVDQTVTVRVSELQAKALCQLGKEIAAHLNATDGWIEWKGGKCPVPRGTTVQFRHRSGDTFSAPHKAECLRWETSNAPWDIVAYLIVKLPEGWIEWKGHANSLDYSCPEHLRGSRVEVVLHNGDTNMRLANAFTWSKAGDAAIRFYRVIKSETETLREKVAELELKVSNAVNTLKALRDGVRCDTTHIIEALER